MGERLRLSAQRHHPSREGIAGGANGEVSWLRAHRLAFPVSQWRGADFDCPLQWRGRAGLAPASVYPAFAFFLRSYASEERWKEQASGSSGRRELAARTPQREPESTREHEAAEDGDEGNERFDAEG